MRHICYLAVMPEKLGYWFLQETCGNP